MSDLISRQWLMECVNEGWIKFDTEKDENRFIHLVRDMAPSAEEEPCEDAVSRKAAIDAQLKDAMWVGYRKGKQAVQPEIIHCKECKYGVQDEDKRWYCRGLGCQVGEADGSGFCADAERRTDE